MADDLKTFFEEQLIPERHADEYTRALGIQCATGVLLIQVAKADSQQDDIERAMVVAILQETFDLLDETVEDILQLADGATAKDVSQLIKLVNDHYGYNDKEKLIEYLWMVAFADGRLDRYEEQFIVKVAELLNISEADFNHAKVRAEENTL
ncbi:MAG: TerB family tellurite resistance protein [Pseudomonadales bacterium]|nr:TerB family tellurite resistance protein [Pseudomonadales bacterium]MBO6566452.1 TerB family tellurite resistance protein [Pseudomonadales bacterium]MBO6594638.1 TerB family tellurite resistance protein [Pseudomonadales bacterium]MBO6821802.1 TerB family tellurite resistance protein [Pseudomonadales bacterium]